MRVLVTGGAGRLGTSVCTAFQEEGFQVRVLDLDTPRNRKSVEELAGRAEVAWGDITQAETVRNALEGAGAVVHMAAILPPLADAKPELARKVNVEGTRLLVNLLKEKGEHVPLVFTSSVAVFGPTPATTEPLCPDKHVPKPLGAYAETKLEAESIIKQSGIDYLILRLTAIMYFNFEVSDLRRMFGIPLNNRLEFCHPDDLAVAIVNAVKNWDAVRGNTLVVSGGPDQRMLYKDMVGDILGVLGLPLPPEQKFTREPYYLDWYDTAKSQELLRFQRKTFRDYLHDYSSGLSRRYSALFLPFMRHLVGPVLGKAVVQFM